MRTILCSSIHGCSLKAVQSSALTVQFWPDTRLAGCVSAPAIPAAHWFCVPLSCSLVRFLDSSWLVDSAGYWPLKEECESFPPNCYWLPDSGPGFEAFDFP